MHLTLQIFWLKGFAFSQNILLLAKLLVNLHAITNEASYQTLIFLINKLNNNKKKKKGIHPENYREVVFKDMSNEETFITRSTVASKETIEIDGVTYPLVKLEITSSSHPFFTGKQKLVDTAGRVDKFMSRYGNRKKK